MKATLLRIAKYAAYPAFYVLCLGLFGYLTFPYGLLKDRVIAEFSRKAKPGQRLSIDKIDAYWFSGVELTGVKLTLPPDAPAPQFGGGMSYGSSGDLGGGIPAAPPPKETTITIDEAHARVRILPLLIGRVRVDFWASVFGGEVSGTVPVGGSGGDVALAVEHVDLGKIDPLVGALGLPLKGSATGKLELSATDGKFTKANGTFELSVSDIVVGDGKTKIQGILELPTAKLGTLTVSAEAKDGVLKVNKLAAQGLDLELIGDGRVTTKEPWDESGADLYARFKFTDAYRTKSDTTKSLLGDPGSPLPGLIEMQVPKMKKAKRADGFYGWHVHGMLKSLKFDASAVDVAPAASAPAAGGPTKKEWKKPAGLNFPVGPSIVKDDPPATPPPPTPPPPTRVMNTPEVTEPVRIQPPMPVQEQPVPPPPPAPPPVQEQPAAPVEQPPPQPDQPVPVPQ